MKQLYTFRTLLLLALFALVGGGSAMAQLSLPFTETFDSMAGTGGNDDSFEGSVASGKFDAAKCDNTGWTVSNAYAAKACIKLGTSSKQGSATTPSIAFESGKTYTITFKAAPWSGDATTLNLSTTAGTLSASTVTMTDGSFEDFTVTLTATGAGTVTFQANAAKKARFFLDEVSIKEEGAAEQTKTALTFANDSYTFTVGDEAIKTFTGQTATLTDADGNAVSGTLTYTSSNTDLATVAEDGKVTLTEGVAGTATITAAYAGDATYIASKAAYTIDVYPAGLTGKGTAEDPYTIADANTVIAAGLTPSDVYVEGIVSSIKEISTSYGNATYYISEDGTSTDQFMIYRGYSKEGNKFTATDELHVGDNVVVCGKLVNYNGTYEMTSGSKINSLECPHVAVTIGATTYATLYYGTQALIVPDGINAYTYTVNKEGKLDESYVYAGEEIIPAGTGVVLQADAEGVYLFTKTAQSGDVDSDNLLKGSDEVATTTGGDVYYKLSLNADNEAGTIGFYWGAEDGAAFENGAHKAYLALTTAQANGVRAFLLSGDATGIQQTTTVVPATTKAYDLQGRRVSALGRGLYIINGKKVIK